MEIVAKSAEQAFHLILERLRKEGVESAPRSLKIKELLNCCVEIKNPRDRIVSCPERHISMAYAFGEFLWYLSGRNDLEMMKYYSKFIENCSDDGATLNSAYGYRIFKGLHPLIPFDQWEQAKKILKEDKDSRQAIIHLHTPNNKKTKDEVCTLTLQFLVRNGKLNMITTMRSNDLYLGFVYDVFNFTMLMEIMANELGVELGTYYHNAASMHLYERNFDLLEKHTQTDIGPMSSFDFCRKDFDKMIEYEKRARNLAKEGWTPYDTQDEYLLFDFMKKAFALKAYSKIDLYHHCVEQRNAIIQNMRDRKESYADVLQYLGGFEKQGKKIIICGVDGAGKTTLANSLTNANVHIQHYLKPSKDFSYASSYLLNIISDTNIIFDRFFFSEIVYAKTLQRKCCLNEEGIARIFLELYRKKEDVKFIFIIADKDTLEVIKSRLKKEDRWLKDNLSKLNEDYKARASLLKELGFDVEIRKVKF